MPTTIVKQKASLTHEVGGENVFIYFIPKDVYAVSSSVSKGIGILCTTTEAAEIPITPKVSREIMGPGKEKTTIESEEVSLDPWTISFQGGDTKTMSFLLGLDPNSATNQAPKVRGNYGIVGHLLIRMLNTNREHRADWLIMNVEARIPSVPAITADGSISYQVEFKSASATVHYSQANKGFSVEIWKSPNADAPDGTNTTFTLGTGNESYTSATTPIALSLDSTATGYKRYFNYLIHNGAAVSSAVTFNASTSVITFPSAPATGSLMAVYLVDLATTDSATFDLSYPTTNKTAANFPWQEV
jgi:hypothetical protein